MSAEPFEICGHVLYPGGNEIICVAEKGHDDDKHLYWPRELVSAGSTSVNYAERAPQPSQSERK